MGKDYAKFSGEIAKGIKIGESSVEVKLLIPMKQALPHLIFLSENQGEELLVHIGDPQASFDFDDEERDDMYRKWTGGHHVTTDSSGVVISAEKQEPARDENQAEMFGPQQAEQEPSDNDPAGEGQTEQTDQEAGADDELPEWMRQVGDGQDVSGEGAEQPDDDSEPREMSFNEDESG